MKKIAKQKKAVATTAKKELTPWWTPRDLVKNPVTFTSGKDN